MTEKIPGPIDGPPLTLRQWQLIANTCRKYAGRARRSAARARRDHDPNTAANHEDARRAARDLGAVLHKHFGDALGLDNPTWFKD